MTAALLATRRAHPAHERARLAAVRPDPSEQVLRAVGLVLQAAAAQQSIGATLSARLSPDDDANVLRALAGVFMRATQLPAETTVPEWAGALALDTVVAAFVDLMTEESVVAQLPIRRYAFAGRAKVRIPARAAPQPSLAATFRREGDPLRVGALVLTGRDLVPKPVGVLSVSTSEMIESAAPGELDMIVREGILADSSKMLDQVFFDATAGTDVRPAGLQAVGVVTPASGTTHEAIAADMRAALSRLHAAGFGNPATTRWIVNAEVAASLAEQSDEMRLNGTVLKIEVVSGLSVPADAIFLVDCAALSYAADVPAFASSAEADVVMQDGEPIVGGVNAAIPTLDAGVPARSLWQTNCVSTRATWPVDWQLAAAGAAQVITEAAVP